MLNFQSHIVHIKIMCIFASTEDLGFFNIYDMLNN